jgi:hypothetical protein
MKVKLFRSLFLHLGTPFRDGRLVFPGRDISDWKVKSNWGIAYSGRPYFFVGFMGLEKDDDPTQQP